MGGLAAVLMCIAAIKGQDAASKLFQSFLYNPTISFDNTISQVTQVPIAIEPQVLKYHFGEIPLAAALNYARYDYRLEFGDGARDGKHGDGFLPESFLWRRRQG
jgi:hypothetical protein